MNNIHIFKKKLPDHQPIISRSFQISIFNICFRLIIIEHLRLDLSMSLVEFFSIKAQTPFSFNTGV
ncbi:MAG: hypothetical protein GY857_13515 [Desulfobacula sp.]|nr:hypothetical protein [Desulfobacula sp.]